jgi:hypothetical protein
MGQNLYQDAIAEARQLREMAEQNAKNVIIDAVTPRIRTLIEQQLVEGGAEETELVPDDMMPAADDADTAPVAISSGGDDASGDTAVRVGSGGDVEIEVGGVSISLDTSSDDSADIEGAEDDVLLDDAVAEALARVVASSNSSRKKIRGQIRILERRVGLLKEAFTFARNSKNQKAQLKTAKIFESLAREAVSLRESVIITEQNTNAGVLNRARVDAIIKEMKDMSKRNNRNIFDFLFEAEDSQATGRQALSELDLVLSDEDLEALGVEDPAEASVDALDVDVQMAGGEDEVEEESEDGDDEGDELEEMSEMEEMDEVYEIDEAALRREIRRLRKLNENDPVDGSGDSSFGGGDAGDEMFVDVDEDDLLDALEDELGDAPLPDAGPALPESRSRRTRRQRRIAESRRGRKTSTSTQRQLNEYKKAAHALKAQLTEMNLFNAKLLYANKLMQNRNLNQKQQRAIVEALDNAKTLREAKLLYQSLTKSLNKVPRKNLNEGSLRTLGSSSKSTRSGSPANSGAEVDRWATLAGLYKD